MRVFLIILIFFLIQSCGKPKTVLICGDHACINKTEAKQYFEENLSIEVKIINTKKKKQINLVELNLRNVSEKKRQISIEEKITTNKEVKILSNEEIKKIKKQIKENKKGKDMLETNKNKKFAKYRPKVNVNSNVVDICAIIVKCSIDEISKFLLQQGKKKDFPSLAINKQ